MNISCGTDIIEIDRIKKAIERFGAHFLNTIYTENEIQYCENKGINKYQHYAARFAAKEAAYKALSEIVTPQKLTWKEIEIINNKNGRPKIEIKDTKIKIIDISISHCKKYAVAMVTVLH